MDSRVALEVTRPLAVLSNLLLATAALAAPSRLGARFERRRACRQSQPNIAKNRLSAKLTYVRSISVFSSIVEHGHRIANVIYYLATRVHVSKVSIRHIQGRTVCANCINDPASYQLFPHLASPPNFGLC
ncbi:hypothetical protein CPB84DRAFT_1798487, partial [Gymnopilus junonius]